MFFHFDTSSEVCKIPTPPNLLPPKTHRLCFNTSLGRIKTKVCVWGGGMYHGNWSRDLSSFPEALWAKSTGYISQKKKGKWRQPYRLGWKIRLVNRMVIPWVMLTAVALNNGINILTGRREPSLLKWPCNSASKGPTAQHPKNHPSGGYTKCAS